MMRVLSSTWYRLLAHFLGTQKMIDNSVKLYCLLTFSAWDVGNTFIWCHKRYFSKTEKLKNNCYAVYVDHKNFMKMEMERRYAKCEQETDVYAGKTNGGSLGKVFHVYLHKMTSVDGLLWQTCTAVIKKNCGSICNSSYSNIPARHETRRYYTSQNHTFQWKQPSPSVRDKPPWRVLFFGTDNFSLEILKALNENRMKSGAGVVDVLDVVSNKGKTPVRSYAESEGITVCDWPVPVMPDRYDVGVLASFGHLVPAKVINMFPFGILNVHPSLLPRWRGASPIIHTILNGDTVTGVSVMDIQPKHFDVGSVLARKVLEIPGRWTSYQLSDYLATEGAHLIIECLASLPKAEGCWKEQDSFNMPATIAHKIIPSMTYINWTSQTTKDIDCHFRAVSDLMRLRSLWKGQHVKLLDMVDPSFVQDIISRQTDIDDECPEPGIPVFNKKHGILLIRCKDGWVGFTKITIRKTMPAQAFYNGYLSKPENRRVPFESVENGLSPKI